MHYAELKDSYLFYKISQKINAYLKDKPGTHLYRMGIGDVSLPLCDCVIKALHEAVDDQAIKERFHGYMPECGAPFLRQAIATYYKERGVALSEEEVFVSSGASDELGDILDLFAPSSTALVIEPAYPAYVDVNVIAGRKIIHLASGAENGFLPEPNMDMEPGIIYICSPNNPTGAVFDKEKLQAWVDYANRKSAVILFFDYLLQEIQVVGTPGDGFGDCGKGYFRFSTFGCPEDTREAAERLVKLLGKK